MGGAAISKTVTAVSEVPAKVVTPSESENIVTSLGADGTDSSGHENELLSFVGFYHNKSNVEALRRSVLSFFIPNDICQAKKLLSSKYATKLQPCQFSAERRNSSTRAAHEAEIDDIISKFDILDLKNGLDGVTFVASNLENLFGPEEFNLAAVVNRQVRADAAIKDISAAIDHLTSTQVGQVISPASDQSVELAKQLIDVQQKMDLLCASVNARLDHNE